MSTLYKVEVFASAVQSTGLTTMLLRGQPLTVDGTPMVRLPHGTIVEAKGWHAELEAARRAAANEIEGFGQLLLNQAERIRTEGVA